MALSAYIKRFGYCDVELLNGQTPIVPSDQEIVAAVQRFKPDVVGVTTPTLFFFSVMHICRLIKAALPETKIVLGGPHLTIFAKESVAHPEVDFGVAGEGEYTFLELLQTLDSGGDLAGVQSLVWKRDGEVVENAPRVLTESLDALPMPDFGLFDLRQHRIPYDDYHPSGVIISSRGCPYQCSFCSRNYPYYRMRSAGSVVDEMQAYKDMGYKAVSFYDESFNVSKKRVLEICRLVQERHLNLPWSFRGRVDRFDEDTAKAMAAAGCVRAHFGVESGAQEVLDEVCKNISLEQVRDAFRLCKKYGISTVAFFILGLPRETKQQARRTIDFALNIDPDYVLYTSLMPMPGSPIYLEALAAGAFSDYWREFARNPVPDFAVRTWETGMTEAEIFDLMLEGLARFYLRPRYIARRLRQVKSFEDLRAKTEMGLQLIGRMAKSALR